MTDTEQSQPRAMEPPWMRLGLDRAAITRVVTHLDRRRPGSQDSLAQDDLTIAYLDAGRRVLERHVLARPSDDDDEDYRPVSRWVTRGPLFAEVRNGPDSMLRNPSAGSFRDRWDSKDDFTDDLIAYVFWSHHLTLHAEARRHVVQELTDRSQSVAAALEEAAYINLKLAVDSEHTGTRLARLALQPLAASDAAVREASHAL